MSRLFPPFISGPGAFGLLIIRVIVGAAFIIHGYPKIQKPLDWMPPDHPVPGVLQACAAVAEFGGGIAWILGLLTPLASLGIICTMTTAIATAHLPNGHPFVSAQGGPSYELAAAYLGVALALLLLGPGKISLDAFLFPPAYRPPQTPPLPPRHA